MGTRKLDLKIKDTPRPDAVFVFSMWFLLGNIYYYVLYLYMKRIVYLCYIYIYAYNRH